MSSDTTNTADGVDGSVTQARDIGTIVTFTGTVNVGRDLNTGGGK